MVWSLINKLILTKEENVWLEKIYKGYIISSDKYLKVRGENVWLEKSIKGT